jgi:hypothetical protein
MFVGIDPDHDSSDNYPEIGTSTCGELMEDGVAQEAELGLHHPKPVVGLKRLSCLGEERRVRSREVAVGGRS